MIMLKAYIITLEDNLKGDKTKKTYNYSKFDYLNKKYYQITNTNQENNSEHIIFFVKYHTIISSTALIKSNQIKNISKCNTIYITLKKGNYYIDWEDSTFYDEIIKKRYENVAGINYQIINYTYK